MYTRTHAHAMHVTNSEDDDLMVIVNCELTNDKVSGSFVLFVCSWQSQWINSECVLDVCTLLSTRTN